MDDSVITCDEIIAETVPTNFNKHKATCKTQNFYILLALITTTLLIAFSIHCYLIKYRGKQKHLLPFHVTNNELQQKHLLPFHVTNNELQQVLY